MHFQLTGLFITVLIFFLIGGTIDYWQSARHHGKYLHRWLNDYFGIIWLILYTFLLPGLMVLFSSGKLEFFLIFLGASSIGSVLWDLTYSLLDQKKLISKQKDYFYFKNIDFGLSARQVFIWHTTRISFGSVLLLFLIQDFPFLI